MELEELLYHVEKRVYSKNKNVPACILEDYIQEARIHAWKDVEAGYTDPKEIVRRAANRVRGLASSDEIRKKYTGQPSRSTSFSNHGAATREKIRQYRNEYYQLHQEYPNGTAIAKALGLSNASVYKYLKTLNEIRDNTHGLEFHAFPEHYESGYVNPPGSEHYEYGCFETPLIRRMVIAAYIARCPEKEQRALYYRFWEDRTHQGVTDAFGGGSPQRAMHYVDSALNRLRILMEADSDR